MLTYCIYVHSPKALDRITVEKQDLTLMAKDEVYDLSPQSINLYAKS